MESLGLQIKHRFTRGCKVKIFQTFAEVRHQATETLLVYLRSFLLHLPSFFSFCLSLSFYLPSSLAPYFTDLFLCLLSSSAFFLSLISSTPSLPSLADSHGECGKHASPHWRQKGPEDSRSLPPGDLQSSCRIANAGHSIDRKGRPEHL